MDLDRITPALRPVERPVGTQSWRGLLFLHWPVSPEALRPLLPRDLALDLHDGVAYVGLVPFEMRDVRTWWMPRFLALDLLETNVRTYVHHAGCPGVFFFSLDAASLLAVLGARASFGLPYFFADMRSTSQSGHVRYRMRRLTGREPRLEVDYRIGSPLGPSVPGTLQHWLVERYLLFVQRGRRLYSGQVHHPPYPLHEAQVEFLREGLIAAAGLPPPQGPPPLAHYSPGVDVEVFGLKQRV